MKKSKNLELPKWVLLEDDENYIVMPEFDNKSHSVGKGKKRQLAYMDCPCKPKLSLADDNKWMIIHNCFLLKDIVDKEMDKYGQHNMR